MMKVTLLVPTNKPVEYIQDFLLKPSSTEALKPLLEKHPVGISLISQRMTEPEFAGAIDGRGFASYQFTKRAPERPVRFNLLNQIGAIAARDSEHYLMVDDNLEFRKDSGRRILQAVDYMDAQPRCGSIQFTGHLGGSPFGERIVPVKSYFSSTARGILFRNINDGRIYTEEQCRQVGPFADCIVTINALCAGYYFAKSFNHFTQHRDKQTTATYNAAESDNLLHDHLLEESFLPWFEKEFLRPFKFTYKNGFMKIGRQWNKEIERRYIAAGGSMDVFE